MTREYHLALQHRGLLALPADLRRRHHLDQPGAQVHVIERDDGVIELRALAAVPAVQAWFWTKRWREMEAEADADIATGATAAFDDVEALFADLDG